MDLGGVRKKKTHYFTKSIKMWYNNMIDLILFMIRVAINGFGRIGRAAAKIILTRPDVFELVAVNDLADHKTLGHLFAYDSFFGKYEGAVLATDDSLEVNGVKIAMLSEPDPSKLPWEKMGVDVVLECTGRFTTKEKSQAHLNAGATKVLISAPAKDDALTLVYGVNEEQYQGEAIVSNASCTTNCLAPVAKVLNDAFGVEQMMMSTIHSYTASQNLVDAPHKDLRRARSANLSIIPTTTGAAKAVTKVIPSLQDKMTGMAFRIPTPNVSLVDAVFLLKGKDLTKEEINAAFDKASTHDLDGILAVSKDPLVSVDYKANPNSATVDSDLTEVCGPMVKVVAWYDNEWGYATRLVDMAHYICSV